MGCKDELVVAKAEIQGLNQRNKSLEAKMLQLSQPKQIDTNTKKLERSSIEAYAGIAIGASLAVFPVTWWLRIVLFAVLEVVCVDFCWRSPFTYKWNEAARALICVVVFALVGWQAKNNVMKAYYEDRFPWHVDYMLGWGGMGNLIEIARDKPGPPRVIGDTQSKVTLDPSKLQRFADDYRLWAVCFHSTGATDPNDVPVSGSGLFDIEPTTTEIRIPWSPQFISEYGLGATQTSYALLLIPKKIKETSFTTLRGATENGAVILQRASGPP